MAGRDKGDTKEFRELTFAEQARSITATINKLQAAIEHHVEHSPRRIETIEEFLAQIDRLGRRLRDSYYREGARAGSDQATQAVEAMPRVRVGSPHLARPEQAADFAMEVGEESRDAALRTSEKEELDRRLAAMRDDPHAGSTWEDVKARLRREPEDAR